MVYCHFHLLLKNLCLNSVLLLHLNRLVFRFVFHRHLHFLQNLRLHLWM